MNLDELNAAPESAARAALERCCGAKAWVDRMCASRPFASRGALLDAGSRAASSLGERDWREAFAHHPRIGDSASLRGKFAATAAWAGEEQEGAAAANEAALEALARGNREYEARFGYIFIVCASGLRADQMLAMLAARLSNDAATEIRVAAEEQMKITRLRLGKLLADGA